MQLPPMPFDRSGIAGHAASCESCQTVNSAGARFCRKCGAIITGPPTAVPSNAAGTRTLSGVVGAATCCPICGAPGRVGAKFCAKCGSDLSDQGHDRRLSGEATPPVVTEECPGCGARVAGGSVVCSVCGLTLDLVEDADGNVFPPSLNEEEEAPEEEPLGTTSPPSISPDSSDGRCIACGEPLDDDACSCPSCGISYGERSNERDAAGSEQESEIAALCPWCGIPTDADTGRCPQCGRSLSITPNLD